MLIINAIKLEYNAKWDDLSYGLIAFILIQAYVTIGWLPYNIPVSDLINLYVAHPDRD